MILALVACCLHNDLQNAKGNNNLKMRVSQKILNHFDTDVEVFNTVI